MSYKVILSSGETVTLKEITEHENAKELMQELIEAETVVVLHADNGEKAVRSSCIEAIVKQ